MAATFPLHPEFAPEPAPHNRPARPYLTVVEGGRATGERGAAGRAHDRRRTFLLRRLVAVTAVAAVAGGAWAVTSWAFGSSPAGDAAGTTFAVGPGDSLWTIANELHLDADRRDVVAALAEANGGTVVHPGQRVVVPAAVLAMGS